jgi:hypothetical protein
LDKGGYMKKIYIIFSDFLIMGFLLPGCVSLPAVWDLDEIPGYNHSNFSREDVVYDSTIRGFRWRNKKAEFGENEVLRNDNGKKIQNEEDVIRLLDAKNSIIIRKGTKVTAYVLSLIYTPFVLIENAVKYTIGLPMVAVNQNLAKKNNENINEKMEDIYISARHHFDSGELEVALSEWENPQVTFPRSLTYYSDINYWRGRTYEKLGKTEDAQSAYLMFLNYSERSTPSFFKIKYPNDSTWDNKADEAENELAILWSKMASVQK